MQKEAVVTCKALQTRVRTLLGEQPLTPATLPVNLNAKCAVVQLWAASPA